MRQDGHTRRTRPPYCRVSCDDAAAKYRVLAVADWTPFGANPCVDVPGASRLFELPGDDKIVCIGEKDASSASTAANPACARRPSRSTVPPSRTCRSPTASAGDPVMCVDGEGG